MTNNRHIDIQQRKRNILRRKIYYHGSLISQSTEGERFEVPRRMSRKVPSYTWPNRVFPHVPRRGCHTYLPTATPHLQIATVIRPMQILDRPYDALGGKEQESDDRCGGLIFNREWRSIIIRVEFFAKTQLTYFGGKGFRARDGPLGSSMLDVNQKVLQK